MAVEVSQTLEYKGSQLNAAAVIELENFTNWKRGSCATSLVLNLNLKISSKMVLLSLWQLVKGSLKDNGLEMRERLLIDEVGPHGTQYCMEDLEQAFVVYTSSRTDEAGSKQFTTIQGPRNFSEATNAWKDKPNFNWARAQSFIKKSVGIKRLHDDLEVTAAKVCVTAAK
ncbi:hypothetical protein Tco_0925946 [Tanacetum coccineum]|uniref:DDE-1 domain-containing protein n=1 Tax=Tanacetum coccineum TaxID=301880 RepID=A0ABQ5D9L6_9ASTR